MREDDSILKLLTTSGFGSCLRCFAAAGQGQRMPTGFKPSAIIQRKNQSPAKLMTPAGVAPFSWIVNLQFAL